MKKNVTIKDIARLANVSSSTVSRVINKKIGNYSKETEEKILKIINNYKFSPNLIAKSLKTKRTKTIGVIFPDIGNVIFSQLYKVIAECAEKRGYTTILGCSYYELKKEEEEVEVMLNKFVDGIIFCSGYDESRNIEKVHIANIPVVIADRINYDDKFPSVLINNALAVEDSVDYLVKLGHRDIKYISFSPEKQFVIRERCRGFIKGLKKNNIPVSPDSFIIDDTLRLHEIEGTYNLIKKIVKQKTKMPTAFITVADIFAIGLIKGLKELGFRIPKDISVMGFDDTFMCEYLDPPLASVNWQKRNYGIKATNLLLDIIEGKEIENKNIILQHRIVERESIGLAPSS